MICAEDARQTAGARGRRAAVDGKAAFSPRKRGLNVIDMSLPQRRLKAPTVTLLKRQELGFAAEPQQERNLRLRFRG